MKIKLDVKDPTKIVEVILLGILFMFLKVINAVDWSWWLVCSPFIYELMGFATMYCIKIFGENLFNGNFEKIAYRFEDFYSGIKIKIIFFIKKLKE